MNNDITTFRVTHPDGSYTYTASLVEAINTPFITELWGITCGGNWHRITIR